MRAVGRRLILGAGDDLRGPLITDLARSPGARLVVVPVEPALGKPPTPLADRGGIAPHPFSWTQSTRLFAWRIFHACGSGFDTSVPQRSTD